MDSYTQVDNDIIANKIRQGAEKAKKNNKEMTIGFTDKSTKPRFILVGDGKMKKDIGKDLFPKAIDLVEEVMNMSKDEQYCFKTIKDGIKWSQYDNKNIHQVYIKLANLKTMKSKFSRGYGKLNAKDLVRRIKRSVYMINPLALIPNRDFDEEYEIYFGEHPRVFFNTKNK